MFPEIVIQMRLKWQAKRRPYNESRETMCAWRTFKSIYRSVGVTPTTTKLVKIEDRNAFVLVNGWMLLKVLREFMGKTRGQFGHPMTSISRKQLDKMANVPFYAIVDEESNRELVHRRHDEQSSKIHINLT